MRLLLVGAPDHRARFRSEIDHTSLSIVGEFATVAQARASGIEADGIVLADPQRRRQSYLDGWGLSDEDVFEERLTARELEVVELLAQGLPNKAIAAQLGISDQTVKFHVAAICGKLGAANRTDAVRRAVRRGLVAL
jgi:DNA-binding NarL/FixJ family response regulator